VLPDVEGEERVAPIVIGVPAFEVPRISSLPSRSTSHAQPLPNVSTAVLENFSRNVP
jgi:hypothetical protein